MMRVLGVDPALRKSGWGLIDYDCGEKGAPLRYVDCGVFESKGSEKAVRLASITTFMMGLMKGSGASALAFEDGFVAKNARSALGLGEVRGVMMATGFMNGMEVFSYAPRTIKQSVTGDGAASKSYVALMVGKLLCDAPRTAQEDAWDALATALCHVYARQGEAL